MTDVFKDQILAGKHVFVAGGSSGINLGIAHRMAEEGASCSLVSRSHDKITEAAKGLADRGFQSYGKSVDVRDYDGIDTAMKEATDAFGPIDILISGAAGNFVTPAVGLSANGFKVVIDIDLIGTFNVLRAGFDHATKPGASMIAITAPQAVRPSNFQAHVCAAKAGINMLIECLALEWGQAGVRVNGISPGPIADTEGMRRLAPTPEAEARSIRGNPLGRWGTKSEIGEMAIFLSSQGAEYVTGTIVDVDGGSKLGDGSPDTITVPERA